MPRTQAYLEVPCRNELYEQGLPSVAQCTPSRGTVRCARVQRREFVSEAEQVDLILMADSAMLGQAHDAGKTSFAPFARSSMRYLGSGLRENFSRLHTRVQTQLQADFGVPRLYPAGALLMRIFAHEQIPPDLIGMR